jgi:hypothetical protein
MVHLFSCKESRMSRLVGLTFRVSEEPGSITLRIDSFDPFIIEGPEDSSPAVTIIGDKGWQLVMDDAQPIHRFGRMASGRLEDFVTVFDPTNTEHTGRLHAEFGPAVSLGVLIPMLRALSAR